MSTANTTRLQFQENGLSIWITIPPKVGDFSSSTSSVDDNCTTKVISLDNLYSSTMERKLERQEDLSTSKLPFLWKVYEMLEDVETTGQTNIVSWSSDGKSFKVHQVQPFIADVIPKYSKLSKYKSFQRQLYFYGFTRINSGPHKGAYHHPKFLRGHKTLCLSMSPKANTNRNRGRRRSTTTSSCSQGRIREYFAKQPALITAVPDCSKSSTSTIRNSNIALLNSTAGGNSVARCVSLWSTGEQVHAMNQVQGNSTETGSLPSTNVAATRGNNEMDFVFSGMPFHSV